MAVFTRGEQNSPTKPQLQLFIVNEVTKPLDCDVVGFRILSIRDDQAKYYYSMQQFDKIQVYPSKGIKYIDTANLHTDAETPGHKLGKGNYYAPWTAAGDMLVGEYAIVWEWKVNAEQPFRRTAQSFAVKELA